MRVNYNIVDYLKSKYDIVGDFNIADIQDVLIFMIFWNNIENGIDNNQYNIINEFINNNINNKADKLDIISKYFYDRYNQNFYSFDKLLKNNNLSKNEESLHKDIKKYFHIDYNSLSFDNKKKMVSYIIYRFRNRLFHGEKYIIQEQNINFIVINNFLSDLLNV